MIPMQSFCNICEFYRSPNHSPKQEHYYPWGLRCMGTDLNRNWGFHFADGGSSFDPCSQVYHGTGPFSEVENRNVRDFVWERKVFTSSSVLEYFKNDIKIT